MGGVVLLTRPQPAANATARLLETSGFEPVVLPLSAIAASEPVLPTGFEADLVAVTSVNAVTHLPDACRIVLNGLPLFAVGDQTAEAARKAGFAIVHAADGGATQLAALIAEKTAGARRAIYLCGMVRKPDLEMRLRAADIEVAPVEVYDTVTLAPGDAEVAAVLAGHAPDFALVYSENAATALMRLIERGRLPELFSRTIFCCLSQAIADRMPFEAQRKRVAARPNEASLLETLTIG